MSAHFTLALAAVAASAGLVRGKDLAGSSAMAPGYRSRQWVRQDWRSVVPRGRSVDAESACGAPGTRTPDDRPALCLPREVIEELRRTAEGRRILIDQAKQKWEAPSGARVPWHPRIRELHRDLERRTPKDRPRGSRAIPKASAGLILAGADLRRVDPSKLSLAGADLSGAFFPQFLERLDLRGANLRGAVFPAGCSLRGSDLSGACLDYADLQRAHLGRAKMDGASLRGANLRWMDAHGTHFIRACLQDADMVEAKIMDASFDGSNLSGAMLSSAYVEHTSFCDVQFKGADLSGTRILISDLQRTDFSGAKLVGTNLRGSDLRGATFSGANLNHANFQQANLSGADLSGADLSGTKVWFATYSDQTKFPPGFDATSYGLKKDNK